MESLSVPVSEFFPANRSDFLKLAGEVQNLDVTDFEDTHRRKHLMSFAQSMKDWKQFDEKYIPSVDEIEAHENYILDLIDMNPSNSQTYRQNIKILNKKYHLSPSKSQLISAYERLIVQTTDPNLLNQFENASYLEHLLKRKAVRSNSGVLVITVLTSPGTFSCPKDCHYCPNEPGQPRSYLSTEPAVLRANQNGWDALSQLHDRAQTLKKNGHTVDKLEILVLGGTWSGYPKSYQEMFIRDLYYAANVFGNKEPFREKKTLEEEQKINETTDCRIIGLTLETRPDYITRAEIRNLRRFGCTRVQIGIQHTDNRILKHINRGHTIEDAIKAIRLLKDSGYKVDIHLMPDLPGSNSKIDLEMFQYVLTSPDLQADQWKIYPCEVTPFSTIEKWYKEGTFVPYAEKDPYQLLHLLLIVKRAVHPWIRLNRVVRDIPNPSIIAGNDITNLRQVLRTEMQSRGIACRCIRCREVRDRVLPQMEATLIVREYQTLGGQELFLSYESEDENIIFGFLRLRLRNVNSFDAATPYQSLKGAVALLRELHVYGALVSHNENKNESDTRQQHSGFGRKLILASEMIALNRGFNKMAIIAGIGTRDYYRKFGYEECDTYMMKQLSKENIQFAISNFTKNVDIATKIEIQKIQLQDASRILALELPTKQVVTNKKKKLNKNLKHSKLDPDKNTSEKIVEKQLSTTEPLTKKNFSEISDIQESCVRWVPEIIDVSGFFQVPQEVLKTTNTSNTIATSESTFDAVKKYVKQNYAPFSIAVFVLSGIMLASYHMSKWK